MIALPFDPTPSLTIPIGGYPFVIYHPLNREELHQRHPDWWWMWCWSSGILLAMDIPKLKGNLRILELGCGLGLASVVAAKLGHDVTCTDVVEETQWYVGHTARSAGSKIPKWTTIENITGLFDHIMFSDILYTSFRNDKKMDALIDFMESHLAPNGEIYFVESNTPLIFGTFLSRLERVGLQVVSQEIVARPAIAVAPTQYEEPTYIKVLIRRNV